MLSKVSKVSKISNAQKVFGGSLLSEGSEGSEGGEGSAACRSSISLERAQKVRQHQCLSSCQQTLHHISSNLKISIYSSFKLISTPSCWTGVTLGDFTHF